MQKFISVILLMCYLHVASAQVHVNNPVDPGDTELTSAIAFVSAYFSDFSPAKKFLPDFSRYWSAEDCGTYRIPDHMVYALSTSVPTYMLGEANILMAKPEQNYIHIKTMFSRVDSAGRVIVSCITNHYITRDASGAMRFIDPMKINSADWRTTSVRNIIYHYPAYHHFDKKKANTLATSIAQLENDWHLQPIGINYYFADTKEEIEHYRGFDFTIAMGNRNKPTGMSDGIDNIIHCGGLGENYLHEVVHIYLNRLFPQSPLIEGLAVFYGGSLGHELAWHVKRVAQYLNAHPEINLNNPDDFYYLDNYTNPLSTIQGLLCYISFTKGGIDGLKRTMSYTSLDELFAKDYKVQKGDWDRFLRKLINDAAQ